MPKVVVVVNGVRNADGVVRVGLFVEDGFKRFGDVPVLRKAVPAAEGTVEVVFEGVDPAALAAAAYHDENDNGELDLTQGGTAAEGRGYSRIARAGLKPPPFDEACFEVLDDDVEVPITLRYQL